MPDDKEGERHGLQNACYSTAVWQVVIQARVDKKLDGIPL